MNEVSSPAMTHDELAAYLAELERQAVSYRSSDLAEDQATAIDFYEAQPFGDEIEGRSQVVAPVVQEVVDYMTVSVLRTFISGDRVVEFQAKEEEQERAAEEATEGVNHAFMRQQDGYKVLHDWLKGGLIEKITAVKTTCMEDVKRVRKNITVSEDELAALMSEDAMAAMEQAGERVANVTDNEDGSFEITLEKVRKTKKYVDLPIPNYEFLFSSRTRHEDESDYLNHRTKKTVSDLIEMGFDRDVVESLPGQDEGSLIDNRESATWNDETLEPDSDHIPGMRKVLLREEYARIDYDGDGVAELIKAFRVGNTILEAEEVEDQPFVVFCPFPRPHRMVGNSLADKVMDLQRNRSVVMRQSFDGFYMTISPRWWLPKDSTTDDTIDDLLTVAPGVIVRGKGEAPTPLSQPFDLNKSLAMLEHLAGEQETRTGITRLNQGLDADTLNKTASGQAQLQAQGQQIEEFVARNFAEALSRLFMKKLRLMIEHGDPIAMRVDGEYKQADPSKWTDDMDVTIRVGLGSGKKEARLAARYQIAALQQAAFEGGLSIVNERKLFNTGAGIVRDSGLGDPNDYWIDPDSPEGQEAQANKAEQPDPETQKIQGEMMVAQQRIQLDREKAEADVESTRMKTDATIEAQREQAALQEQLARDKAQAEYDLAQQKLADEKQLAREQMFLEAELAKENARLKAESDANLPDNRSGGDLDK